MRILDLTQGSQEWHEHRANARNASEAPAMMGSSPYKTRDKLLHEKFTGDQEEISPQLQKVFDRGHEVEALARPIAKKIIGEELFPVTVESDDGYLSASLDGLTMDQTTAWECKQWNESKADIVRQGMIPDADMFQVVQHLAVGCERVLYMVTDGTEDKTVATWAYATDPLNKERIARLVAGWELFDQDLASYTPTESLAPPAANHIESLPAITYKMDGLAVLSNLDEYRVAAEALVEESKLPMSTDQDFADAEVRIKKFKEAELNIQVACDQVIAEIQDVDQFRRDLMGIGELIRQARLNSEKAVKSEKERIRSELIDEADKALQAHVDEINGQYNRPYLAGRVVATFRQAIKGLKSLDSIRSAINDELTRAKLQVNDLALIVHKNLRTIEELASDKRFLFVDINDLIVKDPEDFRNLVMSRILAHNAEIQAQEKAQDDQEEIATGQADSIQENKTPQEAAPAGQEMKTAPALGKEAFRKIIVESLRENGLGEKTARKVARLIVDGKVRGVITMANP